MLLHEQKTGQLPARKETFNEAGIRRGALCVDSAWHGDSWTISDSESAILTARLLLFR